MNGERNCVNCGAIIPAGTAFCGNCGARIEPIPVQMEQNPYAGTVDGCENAQPVSPAPQGGMPYPPMNGMNPYGEMPMAPVPKKKKKTGLIVGTILGIIVIALALFVVIGMTAGESVEYSVGTTVDSEYESEFIGIRYTASEDWMLSGEGELEELAKNESTTWEMQATSLIDGSNLIVAVEELPIGVMSMDAYIEALKDGLSNVSEFETGRTREIAGETYDVVSYSLEQSGFTITQSFYLRKIDKYMVIFISTSLGTSEDEMLSGFSAY